MAAKGYRLRSAGRGRLAFAKEGERVEAWRAGPSWVIGEPGDLEELFAVLGLAGRQPA